jgi:phosphoribosyl 1,2-cyclic phosphodiesterase
VELQSLVSGSSGNSCLVRDARTAVLVDAGISCRRLEVMFRDLSVDPCSLQAIILTHEHSDHARGMAQLVARFGLPVYASAGTFRALGSPANVDWRQLRGGQITSIGSIDVIPVDVPHDAAEPFVYRFQSDHFSAAIATDFGSSTDAIYDAFRDLDLLVLEANHDEDWLWRGSYPWSLKKRVASDQGHISNETCGQILARLGIRAPRSVWLAHLSAQNNAPGHALQVVGKALKRAGLGHVQLTVAERNRPGARWHSEGVTRQLALNF